MVNKYTLTPDTLVCIVMHWRWNGEELSDHGLNKTILQGIGWSGAPTVVNCMTAVQKESESSEL